MDLVRECRLYLDTDLMFTVVIAVMNVNVLMLGFPKNNMKWSNLKSMKCPKCGGKVTVLLICSNSFCDFKISKQKFDIIINNLYKTKDDTYYDGRDNLERLNNL